MEITFEKIVLLFFIYAFIGWLWETVYCSIKAKKFVYRGFLIGPYCPIYGFGVLAVLSLISPYQQNIILSGCSTARGASSIRNMRISRGIY